MHTAKRRVDDMAVRARGYISVRDAVIILALDVANLAATTYAKLIVFILPSS
jgi:hypothetical protein